MIRRTLLAAAVATLAASAFAGPVLADGLLTGGRALSNTNSFSANNTAAGIGNVAQQGAFVTQQGPGGGRFGGGALVNSSNAQINNTAAGIGNKAVQGVDLVQRGSGRGALFNSNQLDANNTAAGIGNFARQDLFVTQK
jgi:hypothetical protein